MTTIDENGYRQIQKSGVAGVEQRFLPGRGAPMMKAIAGATARVALLSGTHQLTQRTAFPGFSWQADLRDLERIERHAQPGKLSHKDGEFREYR